MTIYVVWIHVEEIICDEDGNEVEYNEVDVPWGRTAEFGTEAEAIDYGEHIHLAARLPV